MFGFALILTIAAMGGLIAFIGDKLGYKLGKRRFSILGLRPKYTSAIVAVTGGVAIAAGAILTLYMLSADVRTALFGMERLRGQLASLSQESRSKSEELSDTQKQLSQRVDELAQANDERDKANAHLSEVEQARIRAQAELSRLQSALSGLQGKLSGLQEENARVQETRDRLQKEIADLEQETRQLETGLLHMRAGQIVFQANQLLYAGILRGGQGPETSMDSMSDFLTFANQYLLNTLQIKDKRTQLLLVPNDNLTGAMQYMIDNSGPMVVRLQAAGNIVLGERVLAGLYIYPNKLIYKKGQAINSEAVPADTDRAALEAAFMQFLSGTNQKAVADGVLPDPLTGNVGSLELPQMMEVVERMRAQQDGFVLTAVAREDIYTIGPLRVDISVRPRR